MLKALIMIIVFCSYPLNSLGSTLPLEQSELRQLQEKFIGEQISIYFQHYGPQSTDPLHQHLYDRFGNSVVAGEKLKDSPFAYLILWDTKPASGIYEPGTARVFVAHFEGSTTTERISRFEEYPLDYALDSVFTRAPKAVSQIFFRRLEVERLNRESTGGAGDLNRSKERKIQAFVESYASSAIPVLSGDLVEKSIKRSCFLAMMQEFEAW